MTMRNRTCVLGAAALTACLGLVMPVGSSWAAPTQDSPSVPTSSSSTTMVPETTVPPPISSTSGTTRPTATATECVEVFQTPLAGQPIVVSIIRKKDGAVVAQRVGSGPFVPANYEEACGGEVAGATEQSTTSQSRPPTRPRPAERAAAAQPVAGSSSFTG